MTGTQRLDLNALLSPAAARVVVQLDAAGQPEEATFDLAGLPRVDQLLVGKPVREVPGLVERLCGICPVAHHLAGVSALERLLGVDQIPSTALLVRRLLHLASVVDAHAVRLFQVDAAPALRLRRFAKTVLAAAGSPGHFPATAIPGGVKAGVTAAACEQIADAGADALAAARELCAARFAQLGHRAPDYDGAELALVDQHGRPDLLGTHLRAQRGTALLVPDITVADWPQAISELRAGDAAPRPYLAALGPQAGRYRVGPVSQLRVGWLTSPLAAREQERWLATDGSALTARAIVALHAVEEITGQLIARPAALNSTTIAPLPALTGGTTSGTGWVDGPRGLLVHHYQADADLTLVGAQILTPTAQNEGWLADLLSSAASGQPDQLRLRTVMEESIREADPCLPCTSEPVGAMDLEIDLVASAEEDR